MPSAKVYMQPGGDEQVIANGGTQTIESGGQQTVESGGNIDVSNATGSITFAAGEVDTADIADDAVDQDKLDEGVDQYVDVTITTGQLLALNATPQSLVAAPGANKAIVFKGALIMLDYNSAAYAGIAAGEDLLISYTDGSGVEVGRCETTGFLDQTADKIRWVVPQAAAGAAVSDITPVANAALVISLLTAEIITGDSPLKIRVYYRVVPTVIA